MEKNKNHFVVENAGHGSTRENVRRFERFNVRRKHNADTPQSIGVRAAPRRCRSEARRYVSGGKIESRNGDRARFGWPRVCGIWVQRVFEFYSRGASARFGGPVLYRTFSIALCALYRRSSGGGRSAVACEPIRAARTDVARTCDRQHPVVPPAFEPFRRGDGDRRRDSVGIPGLSLPAVFCEPVCAEGRVGGDHKGPPCG